MGRFWWWLQLPISVPTLLFVEQLLEGDHQERHCWVAISLESPVQLKKITMTLCPSAPLP